MLMFPAFIGLFPTTWNFVNSSRIQFPIGMSLSLLLLIFGTTLAVSKSDLFDHTF